MCLPNGRFAWVPVVCGTSSGCPSGPAKIVVRTGNGPGPGRCSGHRRHRPAARSPRGVAAGDRSRKAETLAEAILGPESPDRPASSLRRHARAHGIRIRARGRAPSIRIRSADAADARWSPLTRPRTMPRRPTDAPPAWRRIGAGPCGFVEEERVGTRDGPSSQGRGRPWIRGDGPAPVPTRGGRMTRVSTGWRPALALGLTIAVGAIAVAARHRGPDSRPRAESIVAAVEGEPTSVDPAFDYDFVSGLATSSITEPLLVFCENDTQLCPNLATEWTVSDDGLTYTLQDPPGRHVPRRHAHDGRRRRVQHGPDPRPRTSGSYVGWMLANVSDDHGARRGDRGRHPQPARRAGRVRARLDGGPCGQQGVRGGQRRQVRHPRPSAPSAPGRSSSWSGSAATTRRWPETTTTGTRPTVARTWTP